MALKTDYKDDIFTGARKYRMVNNPDGTVSFVDATDYTQEGDYLGSQEVNAITTEVNRIPCFKKAEGNGTAIVLTGPELTDGHSITFIASAANNGAATSINSKPLYKPGTTTSPKLIAGKAYTVWYDASGNCFFLKASAEGTASVGNVLAGKTFSNDDDTGITGTMPNRGAKTFTPTDAVQAGDAGYYSGITVNQRPALSGNAAENNVLNGMTFYNNGYAKKTGTMPNNGAINHSLPINGSYTIPWGHHNGSGKVTQSIPTKAAQTYTPGTANQVIPAGQYLSGAQTIKGDANLIPGNIANGVSIFGVVGNVIGKRFASGIVTSSDYTLPFDTILTPSGNVFQKELPYVQVDGLTFTPRLIVIMYTRLGFYNYTVYFNSPYSLAENMSDSERIFVTSVVDNSSSTLDYYRRGGNAAVRSTWFRLPVKKISAEYYWVAYE